ncbi:MAG: fumarylacetoacetate hydrolase family protein [Deltaproteobacteria bacterium]|nr:fumarylacetoacetate hydrolase family protein [Deltaproteobacteria bacterium]
MATQEMIRQNWYDRLAQALDDIEPTAPLAAGLGDLPIPEAYAVQDKLVQDRLLRGERIIGWKVGATSRQVMSQLGIHEPIYGCMTSGSDYGHLEEIPASKFCDLAVEGEIAFIMGQSLQGPGVVTADVVMATAAVMGAVELVDCRIKGWQPTLAEAVADNSLHAGVILGPVTRPLTDLDLTHEGVIMKKNARLLASACGVEALGYPVQVVTWLANKLAEMDKTIEEGQIVLTGSLTQYFHVMARDVVDVSFSDLGRIQFVVTD